MRTTHDALGRGIGSATLRHILDEARKRSYRRISLETGTTPEYLPAVRLYERHGFVPCEPFGGYQPTPFNRFYTLKL
jgi:putative acetyltransferase